MNGEHYGNWFAEELLPFPPPESAMRSRQRGDSHVSEPQARSLATLPLGCREKTRRQHTRRRWYGRECAECRKVDHVPPFRIDQTKKLGVGDSLNPAVVNLGGGTSCDNVGRRPWVRSPSCACLHWEMVCLLRVGGAFYMWLFFWCAESTRPKDQKYIGLVVQSRSALQWL